MVNLAYNCWNKGKGIFPAGFPLIISTMYILKVSLFNMHIETHYMKIILEIL